jgi:hypothetical protein
VDDAYYIALAKSLAGGSGYSDIYSPAPQFHQHFPPGLPLFLSLPTLAGLEISASVILYKLLLIACGAAGLFLFARFAISEGCSRRVVSAAILLASVSITLAGYTVRVASEMLYFLLSVAALVALSRYERASRASRWMFIAALLLVATILTRSIGVALVAAAVLSWGLRRDFKRVLLILASTALLWLPWILLSRQSSAGVGSYYTEFLSFYRSDFLASLIGRIVENGWLIVSRDIPRMIFSMSASEFVSSRPGLSAMLLPVKLSISALVLFPIIRGLWPRPRITPVYVACYLLPVLAWQWDPSRYSVPLVPFFCLSFVAGLQMFASRLVLWKGSLGKWQPRFILAVIVICVASNLISDARHVLTVRRTGDYSQEAAAMWNETMTAYEWIKHRTGETSIIGCEPAIHPHVYLFTGRKAVPLPSRAETFARLGVTHIIHITNPTMYQGKEVNRKPDLEEFIRRASGKVSLALVYKSAHVSIFEMK